MDPNIEVVLQDSNKQIFQDRYEMPLFFIVGGNDDHYLSMLVGQDIVELVEEKTLDYIPEKPYGVYASRGLLPINGLARTFTLDIFLNEEWPILLDVSENEYPQEQNKSTRIPDQIEIVWIIRALRRMNNIEMAEKVRIKLLRGIYPEKISSRKIPLQLNVNTLSRLYLELSDEQKKYPLVIIIDDLPIQLNTTLGDTLVEISLTQCTTSNLRVLQTSLDLLSME